MYEDTTEENNVMHISNPIIGASDDIIGSATSALACHEPDSPHQKRQSTMEKQCKQVNEQVCSQVSQENCMVDIAKILREFLSTQICAECDHTAVHHNNREAVQAS